MHRFLCCAWPLNSYLLLKRIVGVVMNGVLMLFVSVVVFTIDTWGAVLPPTMLTPRVSSGMLLQLIGFVALNDLSPYKKSTRDKNPSNVSLAAINSIQSLFHCVPSAIAFGLVWLARHKGGKMQKMHTHDWGLHAWYIGSESDASWPEGLGERETDSPGMWPRHSAQTGASNWDKNTWGNSWSAGVLSTSPASLTKHLPMHSYHRRYTSSDMAIINIVGVKKKALRRKWSFSQEPKLNLI